MNERVTTSESCQDQSDSSLSMRAALQIVLDETVGLSGSLPAALKEAVGKVLAEPVHSPIDVPAHRNSAMDGYAMCSTDLPTQGIAELRVVGTAFAGKPCERRIRGGECIRIMTGAKMPEPADTVVIQEQVEQAGDLIRIDNRHRKGQNVRQAGEDIASGSTVLKAGQRLGAARLGLLASLGIPEVRIRPPARVAFFSSGDEIRSIGETLQEGQIYDSNRYTLYGMLHGLGVEIIDMGVIPDREETISKALQEAADSADLILTSGGVSVGEADYIVTALARLGTTYFSKVAIKPGRPLTFGRIGSTPFFGLPGNPVAVMVTFLQFVLPAIRKMMGEHPLSIPSLEVTCLSTLRKSPGRTEFQRGILARQSGGEWVVSSTGRQGSGVLSSMSDGDCFIVLPEERGSVAPGERVAVQPFAMFRCV